MKLGSVILILRIFDEAKMREFYVDYLEFNLDWEHRFDPDSPLYVQVSKDGCILHLSEHHGDACPGSHVRIHIQGIDEYHQRISAKNYRYYHPCVGPTPWNSREMTVQDPFGNTITFAEYAEKT